EIDYNKRLTEVAGNRQKAELLDEAIRAMNALEVGEGASPEAKRKYETAQQRVLSLFFGDLERDIPPIGGEAARIIVEANAKRWKLANQAHGDARIFLQEIATKNNAPTVYRLRKYLEALAESLAKIRKYVLATRGEPYFYLDLQDPMSAPMDILLEGEE
ncbi:MAG: hypothetical protein ACYTBZ_03615, partial [Planctomycetota bacterium]